MFFKLSPKLIERIKNRGITLKFLLSTKKCQNLNIITCIFHLVNFFLQAFQDVVKTTVLHTKNLQSFIEIEEIRVQSIPYLTWNLTFNYVHYVMK